MINSFLQKEKQIEIINRIERLTSTHQALWGKMNVCQMLEHASKPSLIYLGKIEGTKPNFLIKILGQMFRKKFTKDNTPYSKNSPTDKKFISINAEFAKAKSELINITQAYYKGLEANTLFYNHPFFGKLTQRDCAILNYKHLDHHLRQFGV